MPWAWTCLQCNETWSGTASRGTAAPHVCKSPLEYRREFWVAMLRWATALREKSDEQIRALVSRPIARASLVEWIGASWDPAGDDAARMPLNKHRDSAA